MRAERTVRGGAYPWAGGKGLAGGSWGGGARNSQRIIRVAWRMNVTWARNSKRTFRKMKWIFGRSKLEIFIEKNKDYAGKVKVELAYGSSTRAFSSAVI